jgi:hypothetical protein
MTGLNDRVLYIGQSKNLHLRLASYKNARPDCVSRKTIRLVRQVQSIAWETCEDAEAAQLRENELLRLHRPKFNTVNTYPAGYTFVAMVPGQNEVALARINDPAFSPRVGPPERSESKEALSGTEALAEHLGMTPSQEERAGEESTSQVEKPELFGAFKTGAVAGFGALLRLIWAAVNHPTSPHDFPQRLLSQKPPARYVLKLIPAGESDRHAIPAETWIDAIRNFFGGTSEELFSLLGEELPTLEALIPFQRSLQTIDLETLTGFYRFGTRRNYELRTNFGIESVLIARNQLDDLVVRARVHWSKPK